MTFENSRNRKCYKTKSNLEVRAVYFKMLFKVGSVFMTVLFVAQVRADLSIGIDLTCFPPIIGKPFSKLVDGLDNIPEIMQPIVRYHIISFKLLRDVYNKAIKESGEPRNCLIKLLTKLIDNAQEDVNIEDSLSEIKISDPLDLFEENTLNRTLQALFIWMPFNYIHGPENRVDFYGDSLDYSTKYIVEYNGIKWSKFITLHELLNGYVHKRTETSQKFVKAVDIMEDLLSLVPSGFRFESQFWESSQYDADWFKLRQDKIFFPNDRQNDPIIRNDIYCLNSIKHVQENVKNLNYQWDKPYQEFWNLKEFHLFNVNKILKDKTQIIVTEDRSWRHFLKDLFKSQGTVTRKYGEIICFHDDSFILVMNSSFLDNSDISDKSTTSNDSQYILFFNEIQRPILALQENNLLENAFIYEINEWVKNVNVTEFVDDLEDYELTVDIPSFRNVCKEFS